MQNNSLLQLKNVTKQYLNKNTGTTTQALKGVSFDIHHGEIFSLLGVNGAGKTTLSSLIATLHPLTSGEILWNGSSIYNNLIAYRKIVGFCPQKPNLDQMLTLEENLIFAGKYYGMSAAEIAKRKDELIEQYDLGTYIKSYARVLSGGYKQRFVIARSLMHNPKLVILDEPTVGLDPQIRHQLWANILNLKKQGVTVLLTTHYLDEAEKLSDRVCIIHNGSMVTIDTPDNLKTTYQKGNLEEVFLQLAQEQPTK